MHRVIGKFVRRPHGFVATVTFVLLTGLEVSCSRVDGVDSFVEKKQRIAASGDAKEFTPASPSEALLHRKSRVFDPLTLPHGPDSWLIKLASVGGQTANGNGDRIISSQGDLISFSAFEPDKYARSKVTEEDLRILSKSVSSLKPSMWRASYVDPQASSMYADEFTWSLTVLRHTSDGSVRLHTTYWTDATVEYVPAEVKFLVQAAERSTSNAFANSKGGT